MEVNIIGEVLVAAILGLCGLAVNYIKNISKNLDDLNLSLKEINVKFHAKMENIDDKFDDMDKKISLLKRR
jgi:hypothetical protein